MTPLQVKNLRVKHNLSQAEFGRLLWQTERAVKAWEYGERNIPDALQELAFIKLGEDELLAQLRERNEK